MSVVGTTAVLAWWSDPAWACRPPESEPPATALSSPLADVCVASLVQDATPADVETAYWTTSGGGTASTEGAAEPIAVVGAGAEATAGVLTYSGFPSGPYGRNGLAELRGGLWGMGATAFEDAWIEGGLKLHLGATYHASWGTFDLRMGGGYGEFGTLASPHWVGTFTYGVRSFIERYSVRGACDPAPESAAHEHGSVARAFVTLRDPVRLPGAYQITFGIELSPTFFLPPTDLFRLGGGPPP